MAITLNSVRQFKEQLDMMSILCNEMLSSRTHDKLYSSGEEYEDSKIARKYLPDQYYLFRFFDKKIELRFLSKSKEYYLYYENCVPALQFSDEYKLVHFHNSRSSWLMNNVKDIDEAAKIFNKAVLSFIKNTLGEELFYIY